MANEILRRAGFVGASVGIGSAWFFDFKRQGLMQERKEWIIQEYKQIFGVEPSSEELARIAHEVSKQGFFVPTYELPMYDDAGEPVYDASGTQMTTTHPFDAANQDYVISEALLGKIHAAESGEILALALTAASLVALFFTRRRTK